MSLALHKGFAVQTKFTEPDENKMLRGIPTYPSDNSWVIQNSLELRMKKFEYLRKWHLQKLLNILKIRSNIWKKLYKNLFANINQTTKPFLSAAEKHFPKLKL
jgi:hypothetical protein